MAKYETKTTKRKSKNPLIVVVNDDGIQSPGLRAMVRELLKLGEVLIVAPRDQQTSSARSFRGGGIAKPADLNVDGKRVCTFAVAGTPAVAVDYAILLHAEREPALIVSGVNYGENIGSGVTISGTIGAALEAATMDIPALAVSMALHTQYHHSHDPSIDFAVAAWWGKQFAKRILREGLPHGADALSVNVPQDATRKTSWRWTRVSRLACYRSLVRISRRGKSIAGYELNIDGNSPEPDSDVRAVFFDHVVSATPLTFDLTARVSKQERERWGDSL